MFDKRPRITIIYDEKKDSVIFENKNNFTNRVFAEVLVKLLTNNPQLLDAIEKVALSKFDFKGRLN